MAPFADSPPPPAHTALAPVATVRSAAGTAADWSSYVVRSGDSLYTIAARHHTTVSALVARNGLPQGGSLIHPGQKVLVPGGAPSPAAPSQDASGTTSSADTATYTVRSGDTLSHIALRHRTTVGTLTGLNGISASEHIHPGQTLRIPASGASTATTASAAAPTASESTPTQSYTVRSGDTLSHIAVRHRTTVGTLAGLNGLSLAEHIHPGQTLRIPAGGGTAATSAGATTPAPSTAQPDMSVPFNSGGYPAKHFASTTVSAAKKNHELLASMPVPTREQTKAMIIATASRHGVDPALALAIGHQESGWNQRQVSVANAIGVMQVIPMSGDWASDLVGRELNLLDPQDNITAGVVIIRALHRATADEDTAIAGYYQGLSSVRNNGMYRDTQAYVRNIKALRATFR